MQISDRMKDELMRLDFDIHHISVTSRRSSLHHGMVRLIISTLATGDEVENLVKKDVRKNPDSSGRYVVRLISAGKSRIAYVDRRTHSILMEICRDKKNRERVFPFSREEMDSILETYSPPGKRYNVDSLRKAVIKILKDCSFFDEDYVSMMLEGKTEGKLADFLEDFHPFFSGMWDLDDDEVAADFVKLYSEITGISSPDKIAEVLGESEVRIRKLLEF